MSKKYTEGPWSMHLSDNATPYITHGESDGIDDLAHRVCVMPAEIVTDYNSFANARLIAAAPELLEALVALTSNPHHSLDDAIYSVREQEGEGWDGDSVKAWSAAVGAARAAIKKATGAP